MIRLSNILRRSLSFCLLFLYAAAADTLSAQNLVSPQKTGEEIFTARTKQFSEFTGRFNYKNDFNGNPVDQAFMTKMPRDKMVSLLFDMKDPRMVTGNQNYSEEYTKTRTAFITEITEKQLLINSHSPGIIAEARARVTYNGKPQIISLFLNQEQVGKTSIKWVLLSAKGDLFDIFKEDTSMVRFIPPTSHETDFINLKRALEDTDHLQDYASNSYNPDFLTLFFYSVKTGAIKYEYVEDVTYHIIDIPGWYFKVKDFNRNELNSGWLITDVKKNSLSLTEFLKSL
ncbi:MAG: hypothetical protein IPJ16_07070 [Bacteroidales bacterium]|nr:hypothetical protein [Bacteroidales bacterium]